MELGNWFPLLIGGVTILCILFTMVAVGVFTYIMLRGVRWHVGEDDGNKDQ